MRDLLLPNLAKHLSELPLVTTHNGNFVPSADIDVSTVTDSLLLISCFTLTLSTPLRAITLQGE